MGRIYFLFFSIQKIMSNCYIIFLKSFQNFKFFLTFQGLIHEINLLALVTFYELNISFFYTHVAFAYVPDDADYFFFFCFSKALISFSSFFHLLSFLLQKDFDVFHMLLFVVFLGVFDKTYLSFLYTEKKNIKIFFISSKK